VPGKTAASVTEFLARLPSQRRRELERVRSVVRKHLPAGYEETLTRGMIVYQVPLRRYPDTYNGHPLWYAALASQKGYLSLHVMPLYGSATLAERLRDGFKAAGKKLNVGKACIRFRSADDLALDAIGALIASTSVDRFVASAQAARRR
jgi:hypothetical protein